MPNENHNIVKKNEVHREKELRNLGGKIFNLKFDSLSVVIKIIIVAVPCIASLGYLLFYLDVFQNGEVDYLIACLSLAVLVYTFVGKHKYTWSDSLLVLTLYFGMIIPLGIISLLPFDLAKHATIISAVCLGTTVLMEIIDCLRFYLNANAKKIKEVKTEIEKTEQKSIMS